MGQASVKYREFRFVIEDEVTQAYVLCEAIGDCPLGVQGWHHKTFGSSWPVDKILQSMFLGVTGPGLDGKRDDPVLWSLNAPSP